MNSENHISKTAKIGFSFIKVSKLIMLDHSTIGHFNYIRKMDELILNEGACICNLNRIGQFSLLKLNKNSKITSYNVFGGDNYYNTGKKEFILGEKSNITVNHKFDLVDSIYIGDNTVVAGSYSQFYTHSFDLNRERLQWKINIGNNCYIGTRTVVLANITDNVMVGAGSIVNKDIQESGLWASNRLFRIGDTNFYRNRTNVTSYVIDGYTFWNKI
jgi:acetyltransferase-like isoleucine patch superfamily enzyme